MDYGRIYCEFITDRLPRQVSLQNGEFDVHHITPTSLGGLDTVENTIKLSFSDHLFAHLLLAHIHGGKMLIAFFLMNARKKYQGRASRFEYASAKMLFVERKRDQANRQWDDPAAREAQRDRIYQDKPWEHVDYQSASRREMCRRAGEISMAQSENLESLRTRSKGNRWSADNRDTEAFREMRRIAAKGNNNARGKRSPEAVENIRRGTIEAHARKRLRLQVEA